METVKLILPFILPPLLGAIIGFITNAIAISMLFRPYTEKRIFKIRIPFTPGILPRQRYEFAESVGNMVQNQLLTEDALRRQTESEAFRTSVHRYVSRFSEDILSLQPQTILNLVEGEKNDSELISILRQFWDLLLKSDTISQILDNLLSVSLNYLGAKKISELAGMARSIGKNSSLGPLGDNTVKQAILFYVDTLVCNIIQANPSLKEFLSVERKDKILTTLEIAYPYLLHSLVRWLRQKDTFRELTYRGRIIVKNIIHKLNALQKFFVTAGQYDKTIDNRMEEIVTDIIRQIETSGNNKVNKERIFSGINSELDALQSKTLSDLLQNKSIAVQKLVHNLTEFLIDSVIKQINSASISGPGFLENHQSVKDLLITFTGLEWEALIGHISGSLKSGLRSNKFSPAGDFFDIIKTILNNQEGKTLYTIFGITDTFKNDLDVYLSRQAISLINNKVPEILSSIDVKKLVVDKINSLDIKNVERILLSVIQKHLKWINIFGAFLGAIIGMIQIISDRFF
ncbi:MAG: DUF445 family protein [Spirochaetales bacterium]|nr:DUF445 family protein [Spirochaetales bacterium]